jgi:hypothetical protein
VSRPGHCHTSEAPIRVSEARKIVIDRTDLLLLLLGMVLACAEEHRGAAPGVESEDASAQDAQASDAGTAGLIDIGAQDAMAPERPDVDCGAAGPPLSRLDRFAQRQLLCRRPTELIALDGGRYGAEAGNVPSCPTPDRLSWPGGGETCWWDPVCNSVETRSLDAGEGSECCYDVQRMCGV